MSDQKRGYLAYLAYRSNRSLLFFIYRPVIVITQEGRAHQIRQDSWRRRRVPKEEASGEAEEGEKEGQDCRQGRAQPGGVLGGAVRRSIVALVIVVSDGAIGVTLFEPNPV